MTLISEVRESKLFKLIADISVVHWLITVIPGLVAGMEAATHGKPLETVILYFVGVSALVLVALHYGGLVWAKYWPRLKSVVKPPPLTLWRLIVPLGALLVVLSASWMIRRKSTAVHTSNATTVRQTQDAVTADNSASQSVTVQQSVPAQGMPNTTLHFAKQKARRKQSSARTSPVAPSKAPGADMKMLASVLAGNPVPATSGPPRLSAKASSPPAGMIACPNGTFVPEHHAGECGASNVTCGTTPLMEGHCCRTYQIPIAPQSTTI